MELVPKSGDPGEVAVLRGLLVGAGAGTVLGDAGVQGHVPGGHAPVLGLVLLGRQIFRLTLSWRRKGLSPPF